MLANSGIFVIKNCHQTDEEAEVTSSNICETAVHDLGLHYPRGNKSTAGVPHWSVLRLSTLMEACDLKHSLCLQWFLESVKQMYIF